MGNNSTTSRVEDIQDNTSYVVENETTQLWNPLEQFIQSSIVVVIICLIVLGIVGNVFLLTVWCMETSFHVTVFLFKVLAVVDMMYLASILRQVNIGLTKFFNKVALYLGLYAQLMSVHVTLLIAVSRWIAVTHPFRAQQMMTSRRIYSSCAVIAAYCGIFEAGEVYYYSAYDSFRSWKLKFKVVKDTVGFIFPLLLMLVFNVSLLWTATRRPGMGLLRISTITQTPTSTQSHSKKMNTPSGECVTHHSKELRDHGSETLEGTETRTREDRPQQTHLQGKGQQQSESVGDSIIKSKGDVSDHTEQTFIQRLQKRHMVLAVLLVSLCSFIAYPVHISVGIYLEARGISSPHMTITYLVTMACQVFNSSINVFIYWFFVSRFRQLAKSMRNRLRDSLHRARGT